MSIDYDAIIDHMQDDYDALAARLAEAERLLRDIYSYAEDQGMETLMDMIDADKNASVSAEACLGGAPHWWDINADTGQTECRLCHKSPTDSASTVSEDCGCPDGHEVHSCCASLCPRSNRDWKRAPPMNAVTVTGATND